ncbi:MAG: hypothetical protein ACREAW_10665 [Nitrososphaera sp.]
MSTDTSEVAIACQCGQWFKQVRNFVLHARGCDKFFAAAAEDSKLIGIYEELLHLQKGALSAC